MNKFERLIKKGLASVGIYPDDGKQVVYIRKGELCEGTVIGSTVLTGHTPLSEVDSVDLMSSTPFVIPICEIEFGVKGIAV